MKCNACWRELEGRAVTTTCGHLLCILSFFSFHIAQLGEIFDLLLLVNANGLVG